MTGWHIIVGDNSGHEYVIPEDKKRDWDKWQAIPEDDPKSWQEPIYALRLEGNFRFREFEIK